MTVKDIMDASFISCSPQTSLKEAARLLVANKIAAMPVLADGKLVGVVSEADLLKIQEPLHIPAVLGFLGAAVILDNPLDGIEVEKQLKEVLATEVGAIMSKEVKTAGPDADVKDVADIMIHHGLSIVPVVEGEKLVGVVRRADIVKLLIRNQNDRS